jgi:hypothetical protein
MQYTLVVTSARLIFARLGAVQMQEVMAQSKARATGFMGKMLAGKVLTPKDIVEYCRRYFAMAPDSIVTESTENYAIPVEGISKIYIDRIVEPKDEDSHIRMDKYTMTILHSAGKNEYVIDADPQDLGILRHVLGEKVQGNGRVKPIRPSF